MYLVFNVLITTFDIYKRNQSLVDFSLIKHDFQLVFLPLGDAIGKQHCLTLYHLFCIIENQIKACVGTIHHTTITLWYIPVQCTKCIDLCETAAFTEMIHNSENFDGPIRDTLTTINGINCNRYLSVTCTWTKCKPFRPLQLDIRSDRSYMELHMHVYMGAVFVSLSTYMQITEAIGSELTWVII